MRISSPWVTKFWGPIAVVALFMGVTAWMERGYHFFDSGQTVTPTARVHLVFAKETGWSNSYHCSASTHTGERFTLPRYDGPRPIRSTSIKTGVGYWAVADLPIDKGPLTVSCPDNPRLWLAMPHPPIYYDLMTNGIVHLLAFGSLILGLVAFDYLIKGVRRRRDRKKNALPNE